MGRISEILNSLNGKTPEQAVQEMIQNGQMTEEQYRMYRKQAEQILPMVQSLFRTK